ncbi:hypothetical protein [Spongiimicrobium sp. 2-473A-2-J]|uniref:hypothetical protein n=1 Tax=Eudoraea algarum TaxID=3417568 RepID=UPI003D359F0D
MMYFWPMKRFLIPLLFFIYCTVVAQEPHRYERGIIMDSLEVSNSENESFALYLPNSFDPNKLTPVLFIFEPAARAKLGVKTFIPAAEKYGHLLVCSNNIRNGSYDHGFELTNRLFAHIFSRFSIDENLIYLAGFSGGSRLASAIATTTDKMAGVIACGAGFAHIPFYQPTVQEYAYAGICGDRDMNYREMVNVRNLLEKMDFNHTLITYDGDHRWPPKEQILRAFDWLQVQAHKKGHVIMKDSDLKRLYLRDYQLAQKEEHKERWVQAAENYSRLLRTYSSFFNTDTVKRKFKALQQDKTFRSNLKAMEKVLETEAQLVETFNRRLLKDFESPEKSDLSWWKKELEALEKLGVDSGPEMEKMVARVRFHIFAVAFSRSNPNLHESSEAQQQLSTALKKLVYPETGRKNR